MSHARASIAKPLTKSQEASQREVEEAMKKVKEAQSLISAAAAGWWVFLVLALVYSIYKFGWIGKSEKKGVQAQ